MDIYSPCALGATLNDNTIPKLNCEIIAGAANNQLEDEVKHSEMLKDLGIVYAPDFLINAGGLINVYSELNGYDRENALNQTKRIFDTTLEILQKSRNEDITSHSAALKLANDRINNSKKQ
jgi:leucine dehydrogenase